MPVEPSRVETTLRNADEGVLDAFKAATGLEEADLTRELVALIDRLDAPPVVNNNTDGIEFPEPAPGNGFVVLEAPLELVAVFRGLHPSEMGTAAAQMAGRMRESLVEMRKMPPRMGAAPVGDGTAVAVVTANADIVEANA